eukprot:5225066-Pyramimonas_sp.AAC.1
MRGFEGYWRLIGSRMVFEEWTTWTELFSSDIAMDGRMPAPRTAPPPSTMATGKPDDMGGDIDADGNEQDMYRALQPEDEGVSGVGQGMEMFGV